MWSPAEFSVLMQWFSKPHIIMQPSGIHIPAKSSLTDFSGPTYRFTGVHVLPFTKQHILGE